MPFLSLLRLQIYVEVRHPDSGITFLNMQRKRAHVILPEELLAEVDRLVGERGRSAFLAEIIQREIQRRNLLTALRDARGSWKTEALLRQLAYGRFAGTRPNLPAIRSASGRAKATLSL